MRALGIFFISLAFLTFASGFVEMRGAFGDREIALAVSAAGLLISGSVFLATAAITSRLRGEPALDGARLDEGDRRACRELVPAERPALRRPGYHRRAA